MDGSAKIPKSIKLQERDIALLSTLVETRVMTREHVADIHFAGRTDAAKQRLYKLKSAGMIAHRPRHATSPAVHYITKKGLEALQANGALSKYQDLSISSLLKRCRVSDFTVRHELEIMDVKAAFHFAIAPSQDYSLLEFSTWPQRHEFKVAMPYDAKDVTIKPDGFIQILEKDESGDKYLHECFLELDRSSEVLDTLVNKAASYYEFYKSGGFAERNGGARADFNNFPFRVLIVLQCVERRNNLAERLIQTSPPILRHSWLTTFAEVTANPLGAIWIQPKGYADATRDTLYDCLKKKPTVTYRRQVNREIFVESAISKLKLLDD